MGEALQRRVALYGFRAQLYSVARVINLDTRRTMRIFCNNFIAITGATSCNDIDSADRKVKFSEEMRMI